MHYNITYGEVVDNAQVVSLELAKTNSNIQHDDQNTYFQLLLDAAVDDAERYIDSPILERNMVISIANWVTSFVIPIAPIQSLVAIKYFDTNGAEQTLNVADYRHDEDNGQIIFQAETLPDLEENNAFPIKISCVAGYKNDDVPNSVKSAVLLRFSHKELYREDVPTSCNRAFEASLRPLKRWH